MSLLHHTPQGPKPPGTQSGELGLAGASVLMW